MPHSKMMNSYIYVLVRRGLNVFYQPNNLHFFLFFLQYASFKDCDTVKLAYRIISRGHSDPCVCATHFPKFHMHLLPKSNTKLTKRSGLSSKLFFNTYYDNFCNFVTYIISSHRISCKCI